jgi:predicted nuclease of predicted toxin-antitoxin system
MKILLDTCVWGGARTNLEVAGHDVIWAGDWPEDPGDEEILARAHKEARILMTLDKDFGEIAIARKPGEVTARLDEALANLSE